MLNPIQNQNTKIFPAASSKVSPSQTEQKTPITDLPDSFQQLSQQTLGLAHPSKLPDWKPSTKAEAHAVPEPTVFAATKETIMGGMDSPYFFNGEVMTRREAIERGLIEA